MIYKILLFVSLVFNIALYFGWIDVGQYRNYVDKWFEVSKDLTDENKRNQLLNQDWLNLAKEQLLQKYWKDLEKIKLDLKSKSQQEVKDYLKKNYTWLNDQQIEKVSEYIKQ